MIIPKTVELTPEMEEILEDKNSLEEKVLSEINAFYFLSILEKIDQVIVLMRMVGYKSTDAATVLGVSESYVSQRLNHIKALAKVLLPYQI